MTQDTESQISSRIPLIFRNVGHTESRLQLEQYRISAIRSQIKYHKSSAYWSLKPQI